MKKLLFTTVLCLITLIGFSQDNDLPLNHDLYHYVDRLDIRGYIGDWVHTDIKPYGRNDVADAVNHANTDLMKPNELRWHQRMRYLADDDYTAGQSRKGLWNFFFTNERDFFQVQKPRLQLFINPIIKLNAGVDLHTYDPAGREDLYISNNSRGVVVRGSFAKKIGFYTEVYDNVALMPRFMMNHYNDKGVLPGEGFIKPFNPDNRSNGLDFFASKAYITFRPLKEMRIKFGRDRAFWGNGFQSLLLSDHSTDYLMLSIQTRIWQLEYTNHFTQMIDFVRNKNDKIGTQPRKYAVFHQLAWKPANWVSIGVFESVVYTPWQPNGQRGFELQYLNPIIFFRSVEQAIGSPDNTFLGVNTKLNFLKHFQLYGQFLFDDFNVSRLQEGEGYWGNKIGYQAGLKYIDAFSIPTLDLQFEFNELRPYVYQHFNTSANFSNYGQSLGHGAGANLRNYQGVLRYHPFPAWNLLLSYSYTQQGLDEDDINYGGDISKPYTIDRPQYEPDPDFGHFTGQGAELLRHEVFGRLSYQLFNMDIYADLEGRYRKENEAKSVSVMGGIRAYLPGSVVRY